MLVNILDDRGNVMAAGHVEANDAPSEIMLRGVQGSGNLLYYYFQRCGRAVWLENGGVRLRGALWTCWLGKDREWRVKLRTLAGPSMLATADSSRAPIEESALPGAFDYPHEGPVDVMLASGNAPLRWASEPTDRQQVQDDLIVESKGGTK